MKHVEEHHLEKYVLGQAIPDITREQIEKHIEECIGCRETMERIRVFYHALDERLERSETTSLPAVSAISQIEHRNAENRIVHYQSFDELSITTRKRGSSLLQRKPVVYSMSVVSIVSLAIIIYNIISPNARDENPDNLYLDEANNLILIRNANYETLRKYPYRNLSAAGTRFGFGSRPFLLTDVDGDGKKEFLVSAPRTNDEHGLTVLRVFNADNSLRFEFVPEGGLTFNGRIYDEKLFTHTVEVIKQKSGESLIAVTSTNGRSPSILTMLDNRGHILGQYHHFGNAVLMFTDTLADGKEYIFLCGSCDIDEFVNKTYSSYGIIAVIDPITLSGNMEASHTRGFGFPSTPAEKFYIRLPFSTIDHVMKDFRAGTIKGNESDNAIIIRSNNGVENTRWEFDYSFNRDLSIRSVKTNDGTYQIHDSLRKAGALTGIIDSAYLNDLSRRVGYWNGRQWQTTLTSVQQLASY